MKKDWTLYYNPKCGSCRNALRILRDGKIEPRIVEYLKTPPTVGELKEIARLLGSAWLSMIRVKEPIFADLKLTLDEASKPQLLQAIAKHPILLQRPIAIHGEKIVVARPPEKVSEIL